MTKHHQHNEENSKSCGCWQSSSRQDCLPLYSVNNAYIIFNISGKSSLVIQFVEGHFNDSYFPTIETTYNKTIKVNGQEFITDIIDTAGQVNLLLLCENTIISSKDEYSILSSNHALGIHGYVIVFSITSRQSFEMVGIIRDKILNYTGTNWVPIVLVGNKSDLGDQQRFVIFLLIINHLS